MTSETSGIDRTIAIGGVNGRPRDAIVVLGMVALVVLLPPVVYGYLSYQQFGMFKPTWYVPYEEVWAAWRSLKAEAILAAPLISMNMTSGHLLSNVYALDIQQLILSLALGGVMGFNIVTLLALRRACPARGASGAAVGGGFGLLATISASSTGIIGCCGSALGGGVLALAGIGSTTAAQIAEASPIVQLVLIAGFALNYWRLRRQFLAFLK